MKKSKSTITLIRSINETAPVGNRGVEGGSPPPIDRELEAPGAVPLTYMMSSYSELPLVNSELKAMVDLEDYLRLNRYRWRIQRKGERIYIYREYSMAGRYRRVSLGRAVTGAPLGCPVRFLTDNELDYRRSNLRVSSGLVWRSKRKCRRPFNVQVRIDDKAFHVGSWPTEEEAEEARETAEQVAPALRGHKLSRKAIQRALDLATGRERRKYLRRIITPATGDELISLAASVLPKGLPPEVREDAMQAICLDLIAGNIEAEALQDRRTVNRYIANARGLNDRFRFISTDAPIGDTDLTVGDRLVA